MVGATITLGNNMGGGIAGPQTDYPVQSTMTGADSHTLAAAKFAHEFGHVEHGRSLGRLFYEQQQIIERYNARQQELLRSRALPAQIMNDLTRQSISQQFTSQFGVTIEVAANQRELGAERSAIPVIRQLFNNKATQKAIRNLERTP
jgi:hypothetical protein